MSPLPSENCVTLWSGNCFNSGQLVEKPLNQRFQEMLGAKFMCKQKGFSLMEQLVAVAIILMIAAIAIPNPLRARMVTNELSAVASVPSVSADVTYVTAYPAAGYAE
jgi:prepilin-type N-terminal cleavage/methylation domain-containing protein